MHILIYHYTFEGDAAAVTGIELDLTIFEILLYINNNISNDSNLIKMIKILLITILIKIMMRIISSIISVLLIIMILFIRRIKLSIK